VSQPSADVRAVIVHLRGGETQAAIQSLLDQGLPPGHIVAVDNGSWDGSGAELREAFPELSWLILPENRGFAAGANAGIARALERGAHQILLLNPDCELRAGCVAALHEAMDQNPRTAAAAPRIARPDGRPEPWTGRLSFGPLVIAARGPVAPEPQWLLGTCLLIRAAAWREVGPFEETFFAYFEDVDWGLRARRRGWSLLHWPAAVALHSGAASSGGDLYSGAKRYLMARGAALLVRRQATWAQALRFGLALSVWLPIALLYRGLRGEAGGVLLKLRGYRDGLLGRPLPLTALDLRPGT